ncbi:MAG: HlyD family type I secretion periplasmic adaptor subunit [Magnetococcales bacterium]|nr:HlyD family type I secretion periplasmic adaptor subunit [Magnetococcales bacterium]NGZ07069.1 HlyD family type I secretion periplasmic adaptor subunit [Magnetococcales bacterium]
MGTSTTLLGERSTRHLAKSVLLQETGSPLIIRMIIWFGLLVVFLFVLWATLTSVDEVSRAGGEIVPSGQLQKIQHLGGGVVREILVQDGERVKEEQVLLRLDSLSFQSQVEQVKGKREGLLARKLRLLALVDGGEPNFDSLNPKVDVVGSEQRLWRQLADAREAASQAVTNEIRQTQAEREENLTQETYLRRQLELVTEELKMRTDLMDKGLNSRTVYLAIKRRQTEIEGELARLPFQRNKLTERIAGLENHAREQEKIALGKWLDELAMVNRELGENEEILRRLEDNLAHLELRAPVEGYVHGLSKHAVGEVVASGDTVLSIVPGQRRLQAQVRISPRDIGHVRVGQKALIKFTTYDFSRYGGVLGEVEEISPSSLLDEKGAPYFQGWVRLAQEYVGSRPGENPITPGQTLQAEITTGSKTVMQYLLKPIFASAREALMER